MKASKFPLIFISVLVLFAFQNSPIRPLKSSNVQFYITNAGVTVDGYFDEVVEASIDFDPADLSKGRIHARIPVKSLRTGISARDRHLMDETYFHESKYPIIEMVSTRFKKAGENRFIGHFNLTIKGKTEKVKVPFSYSRTSDKVKFEGAFTINRLHFEVGEPGFILGSNVKVEIEVTD
jgi:polyisoprenoid-binding protein YceI